VFIELMPLLAGRTVMITVVREDEKMLRVNVIPKKVKEDENPAFTTPLSYTGTPELIEHNPAQGLDRFVKSEKTQREATSLKPKEVVRLLGTGREELDLRDYALILTAVRTGLR
jgi:PRTRC genetic system protein E